MPHWVILLGFRLRRAILLPLLLLEVVHYVYVSDFGLCRVRLRWSSVGLLQFAYVEDGFSDFDSSYFRSISDGFDLCAVSTTSYVLVRMSFDDFGRIQFYVTASDISPLV